jgi:acid phosphatase
MNRVKQGLLLAVAASAMACASGPFATPASSPAPGTSAATPPAQTRPATLPDSIRWVSGAAEYTAAAVQAYRMATVRVEAEARVRPAGSWVVVLDADETVISNLTYQLRLARENAQHTPERWAAWVRERAATPLPGAARFLSRVRELGGRIAIVTNRLGSECADTEAVFKTLGLLYDAMLCRPDGSASDKNPRFRAVAAGQTPASPTPIEVVAFVGDNILDFPDASQSLRAKGEGAFPEFGVRWFLVPNPMYGSWQ